MLHFRKQELHLVNLLMFPVKFWVVIKRTSGSSVAVRLVDTQAVLYVRACIL